MEQPQKTEQIDRKKLFAFFALTVIALGTIAYGIILGDPVDMSIEAATL